MRKHIAPSLPVIASVVSLSPSSSESVRSDELMRKNSFLTRQLSGISRVSIPEEASATLLFHNVDYVIESKFRASKYCSRCLPCRKAKEPKQILFGVSGIFKNGINAILGPSGCGKSSLLDVLADRKDPRGLSGMILLDDELRHPSYRYTVGYVVQEDICSETLTVRENLSFSVHLRAASELSATEKNDRISHVISELGLEDCADTRIGTELLRGVSGGERRRTCIGMELVLSPKILFLDEPTTGLDASTARNVMNYLKELSRRGRTVVLSIHQPRYSIFKIFDTVMFMCQGRCIYHGSTENVVPYFSQYGYQCEPFENPADYALDILIDVGRMPDNLMRLNAEYNAANFHKLVKRQRRRISLNGSKYIEYERWRVKVEAARSIRAEIFYLSQRTLRNAIRDPALALSQILVSIVISLLVGLLYYEMKKTTESAVQNRLGAIFFIVISQMFSNVTALEALIKERALFIHEHSSGYYRIFTFFIAKLICDLLPMRVVPSIVFSVIAYFMMGLNRTAGQFFIFLLTIFMSSLFGSALCFFVAASIPLFSVALIVVIFICVVMMMFSGFLIDLSDVFSWLSWIKWISACRYASNMLTINEFEGLFFCSENQTDVCLISGSEILDKRSIPHADAWDMWQNVLALGIMAIGFLVLAYVQLVRVKKTK